MATLIANNTITDKLTSPALDDNTTHIGTGITDRVKWMLTHALKAYEINAERRQLATLTDQQLSDIGITRTQVQKECERSVFDLPKR